MSDMRFVDIIPEISVHTLVTSVCIIHIGDCKRVFKEVYATTPPDPGQLIESGIPSPSVSVSAQGSLGKASFESSTPSPSESSAKTVGGIITRSKAISRVRGFAEPFMGEEVRRD